MIFEKINVSCEGSQEYAALYTYILDGSPEIAIKERPMVIVCPGGGYGMTSDREAEIVAMQFLAMGYHASVLRYSVAPAVFPTANLELGKAILTLRSKASEWNIDKNKIVALGFSAGGHMVASYCMFWNREYMAERLGCETEMLRPNGMLLGYPVITSGEYAHRGSIENLLADKYEEKKDDVSLEFQVSDAVPRTFVWHTFEDQAVPLQNSLKLVNALVEKKIPVEYHIFEKGAHGLGLANRLSQDKSGFGIEPVCECWIELAHRWLENL